MAVDFDGEPLKHTYPPLHQKGSHWATDAAWEILDILKPGALPDEVRFFLAEAIAGRLMLERIEREE